jgi:linoleoyl-CoA desaturase
MTRLRYERETADGFYADLKARVAEHFAQAETSRRAGRMLLFKAVLFTTTLFTSYIMILLNPTLGLWLLPLAIVTSLSAFLLVLNVGHDAAHKVLPGGGWVNRFASRFAFFFTGVDGYLWEFRHLKSHHMYPNVNGSDADIDDNPFVRLSPNQPWRWHFQAQHIYAPVLYLFAIMSTTYWTDFIYLRKKQLANLEGIEHSWGAIIQFYLLKALHITWALVIPLAVIDLPWWAVVLGYMIANGCASLMFVFFLIGTHFCDLAEFPEPDVDGSIGRSWADHNMATACDWSPKSSLAHFLSGGVNAHASHHLFPHVCHTHYPAITRLVEATATDHGYPYNCVSLWGMVKSHMRFLHQLGRRPGHGSEPKSSQAGMSISPKSPVHS